MIKNTEPWVAYAICSSVGTEMFYPEPGEDWKPSTEMCRSRCPVAAQCLDFAMRMERGMDRKSRYGIFGGLTPSARAEHEPAWLAEAAA